MHYCIRLIQIDYLSPWYQKEKYRPEAKYYAKLRHPTIIPLETFNMVQVEIFRRARLNADGDGGR